MNAPIEIHTTTLEQLRRCPQIIYYRLTHPHLAVPSEGQARGRKFHEICGSLLHERDPVILDRIRTSFSHDPALQNAIEGFWKQYVVTGRLEWLAYEEHFRRSFDLGEDYPLAVFVGTIDLVARDRETGKLLIIDLKLYRKPALFSPGLQKVTYPLLSRWYRQANEFIYAVFSHEGTVGEHCFPLEAVYEREREHLEELKRLARFYVRIHELHFKNPNMFCRSCSFYRICNPFGEVMDDNSVVTIESSK